MTHAVVWNPDNPQLYTPFGVFAGLPFWGVGVCLSSHPGIGVHNRGFDESEDIQFSHLVETLQHRLNLMMW